MTGKTATKHRLTKGITHVLTKVAQGVVATGVSNFYGNIVRMNLMANKRMLDA